MRATEPNGHVPRPSLASKVRRDVICVCVVSSTSGCPWVLKFKWLLASPFRLAYLRHRSTLVASGCASGDSRRIQH
eukprot:6333467-Pyramimonas_sp.AAC.1